MLVVQKITAGVLLAVVDINGVPLFITITTGRFQSRREWVLSGDVPSGLSGLVVTFQSLSLSPSGSGTKSNRQVVFFH